MASHTIYKCHRYSKSQGSDGTANSQRLGSFSAFLRRHRSCDNPSASCAPALNNRGGPLTGLNSVSTPQNPAFPLHKLAGLFLGRAASSTKYRVARLYNANPAYPMASALCANPAGLDAELEEPALVAHPDPDPNSDPSEEAPTAAATSTVRVPVAGKVEPASGAVAGPSKGAGLQTSGPPSAASPPSLSHSHRIPLAMVVLAQVEVPSDLPPATPLIVLLQRLLPEHCSSATAAKRALRRHLVLRIPSPSVRATSTTAVKPAGAEVPASGLRAEQAAPFRPGGGSAALTAGLASSSTPGGTSGGNGDSGSCGPPHPYGVVVSTVDSADPGDVLQLLARSGTGHMGWVAGVTGLRSSQGEGADTRDGASVDAGGGNRWRRRRQRYDTAGGPEAGGSGSSQPGSSPPQPLQARARVSQVSFDSLATGLTGLPVAYEDEHLAVVIKPPGIETQGTGTGTVQGRIKYCLKPTRLVGALNRPQQVHRLDAPTGGLLLVAKTLVALRCLAADLHRRRITKRYCALIKGTRHGSGTIDMPLSGKPCVTSFSVVPASSGLALEAVKTVAEEHSEVVVPPWTPNTTAAAAIVGVMTAGSMGPIEAAAELAPRAAVVAALSPPRATLTKLHLWPHTGRTHQLRKHMAYTGTPMLGDPRYRGARRNDPRVGDGGSTGALDSSQCEAAGVQAEASEEDPGKEQAGPSSGDEGSCTEEEAGAVSKDLLVGDVETTAASAADALPGGHGVEEGTTWEVHRPTANVTWLRAAAAAAAAGAVDGGTSRDVLADGSAVSLCLWAVGLRFHHPASGQRIEVDIAEWADVVYDDILRRDAAAAAAARSTDTL